MTAPRFTRLTSRAALLQVDNVDTDQIIPARYLKLTDKSELGEGLFADWRQRASGQPDPDFPLNRPGAKQAQILLTGRNFGSGSSREHAVWALMAHGFQAVIAPSFADIFRGNALKNGLLVVELESKFHSELASQVEADATLMISIDLSEQLVTVPGGWRARFPIDGFSKRCLLEGIDSLGYLLQMEERIQAYEATHG